MKLDFRLCNVVVVTTDIVGYILLTVNVIIVSNSCMLLNKQVGSVRICLMHVVSYTIAAFDYVYIIPKITIVS